jgi:hypothetical protein
MLAAVGSRRRPEDECRKMKHANLRSIAHNIADSLGSGIGLMVGVYEIDVYGEAAAAPNGQIVVDFLAGQIVEGTPSERLKKIVGLYREALPGLCAKHGASVSDFRELVVRYSAATLFDVTIEDSHGRRTTAEYAGIPAQRQMIVDGLKRVRPKPTR